MKAPIIPDWCDGLASTTRICVSDIAEFYGYKNRTCIPSAIKRGLIPEPVRIDRDETKKKTTHKSYWVLGELRELSKECK